MFFHVTINYRSPEAVHAFHATVQAPDSAIAIARAEKALRANRRRRVVRVIGGTADIISNARAA